MIFPHLLRIIHAPIQRGREILCHPYRGLDEEEDVSDQTQDAVDGGEVRVAPLVVLDHDEAGE